MKKQQEWYHLFRPGLLFSLLPVTTSASLFNSIPAGMKIIEGFSIPGQLKAVKNKVEIENIGKAMVKDGIALTKFFHWLENRSLDQKI